MRVGRYLRLLFLQIRASVILSLQYRWDFVLEGVVEVFWTLAMMLPLVVIYGHRSDVAGWSYGEALMVTGFFTLLQGALEGVVQPSFLVTVEHIRKGSFDFFLVKPCDAQFLVSTARFLPWRIVNIFAGLSIFGYGFHLLGRAPHLGDVIAAALLFSASLAILYSIWLIGVCLAFYVIKVDNLTYLFQSVLDAARWPSSVFRPALRLLFTFVIPLSLMTTVPAEGLLGRGRLGAFVTTFAMAAAMLALSRALWRHALGKYASASS